MLYSSLLPYKVTFFTSQIRGAGTAANIYVELQGDRDCSGPLPLAPQRKDSFTGGAQDAYQLKLKWLGQLRRCIVGHDNSGENPAWHLERVEVVCSREPEVGGEVRTCAGISCVANCL